MRQLLILRYTITLLDVKQNFRIIFVSVGSFGQTISCSCVFEEGRGGGDFTCKEIIQLELSLAY